MSVVQPRAQIQIEGGFEESGEKFRSPLNERFITKVAQFSEKFECQTK